MKALVFIALGYNIVIVYICLFVCMKNKNLKYDPIARKFSKRTEGKVMPKLRSINQILRDLDRIVYLVVAILGLIIAILGSSIIR